MLDDLYICALSGVTPTEEELLESEGEIPDSWVKISLTRRFLNPKWIAIQRVKQGLLKQSLEELPKAEREENLMTLAVQVESQYFAMEAETDKYVVEEEEAFIAPPESDTALFNEYNKVRQLLGLEEEEMDPDEDDIPEPLPFIQKDQSNVSKKD